METTKQASRKMNRKKEKMRCEGSGEVNKKEMPLILSLLF